MGLQTTRAGVDTATTVKRLFMRMKSCNWSIETGAMRKSLEV